MKGYTKKEFIVRHSKGASKMILNQKQIKKVLKNMKIGEKVTFSNRSIRENWNATEIEKIGIGKYTHFNFGQYWHDQYAGIRNTQSVIKSLKGGYVLIEE